ncbi:hypothetical protein HYC85_011865 [Camellia sinensis]|uniref:ubiquitinyl hydrolase 1 n=1 Tax=Camellia sinensis TaxID=4442 RepID=A0A7J7HA94_CAMSI|nr:hypothetical protein HYC85_011865 [Camellia sinensis]
MRSNVADASSESSPSSSSSWEEGRDSALAEIRECPFCILEKRIARSLSVDLTLDTPAKMNSCLRIFAEHFRFGRQEDAHEFLRYVIDACHNTCLRLKKLQQRRKGGGGDDEGFGGGTVVKEIFGGALQSQVKCLNCGAESNKVDEIMDISLDVLHSTSLKESMQKFFQAEVLDGNNKYKCENCKKLVTARKQMSLLQAPNVLVIQLKRFEGVFGGKIDKAIAFEEVLVLSSYMCKASQIHVFVELKIISWNVRRLNALEKQLAVKALLKDRKVDLICIQETKMEEVGQVVLAVRVETEPTLAEGEEVIVAVKTLNEDKAPGPYNMSTTFFQHDLGVVNILYQDTHVEYKLFGTIVHSGFSPDSGHYYAYIKDAMGRWYCCNDSYVKLSNLQEVLSEKVYILFFSCTKQRPGPANTALACNGVKSQECNGSDTSKSQKVGHSGKAVYTKQSVDHSFESDNLTRCRGPGNTALISNGVKSQECNGSDAAKGQKIAHSGRAVCAKQSVDHSFENDKLSRCPGPANTALASNRVKFQECNGSDVSKGQKVAHSEKAVYAKQSVDHSFENNNLTRCPGPANTALPSDGVKSECNGSDASKGQKANLSSFGKSGAKRFPASGNNGNNGEKGEKNMSSSKVNFNGNNGDVKASISAEKGEKNMSSSNGNGVTKSKTVEAIDNGNIQSFALANGNGKTKSMPADSVEAGIPEDNHGRNGVTTGTVANKQELKNGGVYCPSDISGLKRKFQDEDSCTLLTKDAHSQAKLEDFKEVLSKEASSGLRSCGWTEEVHRWMWSRKKYPDVGGRSCCTICNTDLFHLAVTSSMSNIWGHVIFLYFTHMMTLRGGSMVTAFNTFISRRNIGACVTDQS